MSIRPSRYLVLAVWATTGAIGFVRILWPVVAGAWGHDPLIFGGNLVGLVIVFGLVASWWFDLLVHGYERWFKT